MASVKKPRVRVSKNKKKYWSKCDIKDVEDFLEDKRFEDRIGGPVSEKPDDELFFIQKEAKEEDNKASQKLQRPLRCFQSIGSYSKVPPPVTPTLLPYTKKITNVLSRADERRRKRSLKKASIVKKKEEPKLIQKGVMFTGELRDLWEDKDKEIDPEIAPLVNFRDEYTRKRTPNVPSHRYQKPSLLPSIEIPHAGASYNPSFEEHQDLLREAFEIEVKKQKQEMHLKRVLTDMFPTKAEAPTEQSILLEMSQGLFEEEDDEDEKETDCTFLSWNPPVFAENRIPKARKRRKEERKEQERLRKLEKIQKKEHNEVYRLRSIKSEIRKEAEASHQKEVRNQERKVQKMFQPRTLSKHKYEAPDLELNLTEELSESLRTLKTDGNLLEDRYKSFLRRNLIEPRVPQKRKRKYKLKKQVKRSHRNFE